MHHHQAYERQASIAQSAYHEDDLYDTLQTQVQSMSAPRATTK